MREAASKHRFLHLATHGYFAPEALNRPWGARRGRRGRATCSAGSACRATIRGCSRAWRWPAPTSGPPRSGKDDGILTALEVAELDLAEVELAVLSACETGLGAVAGGEGLLGLQRAFQVAGAQSVVASLWTVGDEPTRALMARFYENLWRHGPDAACGDPRGAALHAPRRAAARRRRDQAGREGRLEVGPHAAVLLGGVRAQHRPTLMALQDCRPCGA